MKVEWKRFGTFLTCVLILLCLIAFLCMRLMIAGQNRELDTLERANRALEANAKNIELCIDQRHDQALNGKRATALGMDLPTADQIRIVSLPHMSGGAETVSNTLVSNTNG